MGYFDDIIFIGWAVMPGCRAVVDRRFTGTWSVEFMLEGRMSLSIDGGPRTVLSEPALFWHSPQHRYRYGAVDERGWDHHWILMKGGRARRLVEEGFAPLAPAGYLPVRDARAVAGVFQLLAQLLDGGGPQNKAEAAALLERLLCMAMAEAHGNSVPSPYHAGLESLARRIRARPDCGYDFRREAMRLGLSYSRFRRLFCERHGRAPYDFLLHARMSKAAEALNDLFRPVKQVASEAGYDDISQFSRLFRKKIGISPRQYRAILPLGRARQSLTGLL